MLPIASLSRSVLSSGGTKSHYLVGHVSRRYLKPEDKIKWVRPPRLQPHHPFRSGDLKSLQFATETKLLPNFEKCDLIKTANENVKKIFSYYNTTTYNKYRDYVKAMEDSVKEYKHDNSSLEVKIAHVTGLIRMFQHKLELRPSCKKHRAYLHRLIDKRRSQLRKMRDRDYKKFEWLLETLGLKYLPDPVKRERVTRKKATQLLAQLKTEKMKELKLAEYKLKLDKEKIPFLKKKIEKLRWIKEQETAAKLQPTVTDADIEDCIKMIEQVKLQIEGKVVSDYVRKIHPYTLQFYEKNYTNGVEEKNTVSYKMEK